jgi:hypothetical protein
MIDQKELAEVQAAVDKAAPAVQAEIAELDVPWSVTRTGHEVAEPAAGDPFTPFYVSLERHCGLEHTVVAVPGVTRRSEAIRLADAHWRAELAAYQKEVTAILRRHGVWELFNKLNRLKAEAKDVVVVLGRAPTPPEGPRVLNPEAPDAATLAERRLARTNKF